MNASARRSGVLRAMVVLLTIVVVSLVLLVGRAEPEPPPAPQIDRPSPQDFVATADVEVVDDAATAQARQLARDNTPTQYVQDEGVTRDVLNDIEGFFRSVRTEATPIERELPEELEPIEEATPTTPTTVTEEAETTTTVAATTTSTTTTTTTTLPELPPIEEQTATLGSAYPLLKPSTIDVLLGVANLDVFRAHAGEPTFLDDIERQAVELADELLMAGGGILSTDIGNVRRDLVAAPDRLILPGMDPEQRVLVEAAVADLVAEGLLPNRRIDANETEAARLAAEAAVAEQVVPFVAGQIIVAEGEIVGETHSKAIVALDLLEPTESPRLTALTAAGTVIVLLSALFLWRVAPDRFAQPKLVGLFGLLLVLAALAARVPEVIAVDRPELAYLLPAAAFGYLAAILYDPRTSVLLALPVGAFAALASGDLGLAVFAATASITPVPFVSAASTRTRLRLAVINTGLVLVPVGGALVWFFEGADLAWKAAIAAGAGGIIAGIVGLGLLPFFENLFRITTTLTLLDLTDRNHPALRLIEEQAPGTFNHSILVGTLAGKAAREIDANALLAQAAAYYHDLGKTLRPRYFVENQFGVSNPHDELTAEESAEIIREHVTEGMRLARQYRIPNEVAAGIMMHHGKGIMRFFYHKALEQDPGADPDHFRHIGEKPKRKEMAILMLADASEGAVRSLVQHEDPSLDNIAKVVEQIVAEKLEDGQLDDSSLTFGELTRVKQALIDALVGYYHNRIPYPGFPGAR